MTTEGDRGDGRSPGIRELRRWRRGDGARAEQPTVPRATFRSYYGRPVIAEPVWRTPDVPAYLFLGGLAGASSALAAAAHLTGRARLARAAKVAAAGAIGGSVPALIHDLGRPARFLNMLRVVKVSSPMSVGSWLISLYGPVAGAAAASAVTGKLPRAGTAATVSAAALGPAVTTYTAVLLSDTAVPAWHDGHRELPYVFASSAATAAGGLGLLAVQPDEAGPARRLALLGVAAELLATRLLHRRLGAVAEPYRSGRAGTVLRAAELLAVGGAAGAAFGRRSRVTSALSSVALLAASAATRFGVFDAGRASARNPEHTIVPQRERAARGVLFRTGWRPRARWPVRAVGTASDGGDRRGYLMTRPFEESSAPTTERGCSADLRAWRRRTRHR